MKQGTFYAVGVGPGDPEYITLKAVRVIQQCPVVAAPRTRSGEMLALDIAKQSVELEGKTILPLFFAMERDREVQSAAHDEATGQIAEFLDKGQDVAMLNLGDVSLYSTCSYMVDRLRERGYNTVMIPGVPSFCAVAARLGIGLTEMNSQVHIVPAGGGELGEALQLSGTKILMKSGREIKQTYKTLAEQGLLCKAAMVQDCGLPGERVFTTLENAPEDIGYFATIVVKE